MNIEQINKLKNLNEKINEVKEIELNNLINQKSLLEDKIKILIGIKNNLSTSKCGIIREFDILTLKKNDIDIKIQHLEIEKSNLINKISFLQEELVQEKQEIEKYKELIKLIKNTNSNII